MTRGGGLPAGAVQVIVRNACETMAARLAAELAASAPPLGLAGASGSRPTVILFDGTQEADLVAMLAEPAVAAIIDLSCHDPASNLARLPSAMLVRVSTAMCLHHDIAGPVAAALCQRLPPLRRKEAGLRTALQEAIGNAVMHGNLGLDGRLRSRCDGMAAFAHMMEVRARDPVLVRRSVTIAAKWNAKAVVVTVEDCGAGFTPAPHAACLPAVTAASGRGLAQIRAACGRVNVLSKGRRISMRFKLDMA